MPVNLKKGGNVSLAKAAPGMTHAVVGLGWDVRTTDGAQFDLDASAILCDANGKAPDETHFVFYNNKQDPSGAVAHAGDNRTGEGGGDDETITVDLSRIPASIEKVAVLASIDQAAERGQNFGQVSNAYIRVFDADHPDNSETQVRFDLGEDAATETALVFGEIYRNNGEWKFRAVGQGYETGLEGVISDFGLSAG